MASLTAGQATVQTTEYPELREKVIILNNSVTTLQSPVFTPKLSVLATIMGERYLDTPQLVEKAEKIILCESGGKHEVWGKAGEYGIAQFKRETFYWMAKQAKLENPDWKDKDQQVYLLLWALEKGIAKYHWTCYTK